MIDDYSNPYDFTRPIKKQKFFAGREKELKEINHYLSLASSKNPSFHNLSLIGKRASGKTSLLNIIRNLAEEKGLLAVQVALNNESISNDALLFKEVFDGIFAKGEKRDMFGGPKGSIYKSYRKIVETFDAKVEIPFSFGTAYLGLKDNPKHSISQHVLISDFKKFSAEAKSKNIPAIVLLFDECDLFTKNETILQKIRNVFENLDGFVLVFSGTENMFPNMENVFSPIPRFFKRITVENFKDKKETVDCLLKPLSENEKKYFDNSCTSDIHTITNGSPYEINLISHHMYRRWKDKSNSLITLSTQILEDVLNEIERFHGTHREIINKIKHCTNEQLEILIGLLEFPNVSINWLSEFLLLNYLEILHDTQFNNKKSQILDNIQELKKLKFITEIKNKLQFNLDSFDLLFLKYYCASKGIINLKKFIPASNLEPISNLSSKLIQSVFIKNFKNYRAYTEIDFLERGHLAREVNLDFNWTITPGEQKMIIFANPETQNEFYLGVKTSIRFRVNVSWLKQGFVTQVRFEEAEDLSKFSQKLKFLTPKLTKLGYEIITKDEIQWNLEGTNLIQEGKNKEAIECFNQAISLNRIFELPLMNKARAFMNLQKFQKSLDFINKALELDPNNTEFLSLKGWILHKLNRNKESIATLEHSIVLNNKVASTWMNFGNVLFYLKRYRQAIEKYDQVLELTENQLALYYQGICLSEIKQEKKALENFDLILKNDPNDSHTLLQKAILLYHQKHYSDSLKILEKIEKDWSKNISYLELRSLVLYDLNQFPQALVWIKKSVDIDPKFAGGWYNMACFYAKENNESESISALKKSVELDPKFSNSARKEKDFDSIKDDNEFQELLRYHRKKEKSKEKTTS